MQHNVSKPTDNALIELAKCFEHIGWDKKLSDITEEQVLGIVSVIQKMKDLSNDITEQGLLELEQSVTSPNKFFDDPIPF